MPPAEIEAPAIARVQASWAPLGAFLAHDLLLVPAARRAAVRREWEEITEAERNLDDRLTVGIVGGTGVGKSTLINALAGAEISRSGDRRPTTDRVIAYRHRSTRLPELLPLEHRSEPDVVHETAALERVIVLDFPDFDSVEELHHEILRLYFPCLDVLIVLVDDVKYADARLFDLLRRLPQSHENLHAVLNKVDRLERRYPGRSRAVANEILDDLVLKLEAHAGVRARRDRLLAISARNAFLERSRGEKAEAGDFPALVALLEGYRREKRRRAAKELNIEARKAALSLELRAEALGRAAEERAARSADLVERRRGELERIFASIPAGIFTRGERRRIVGASLSRAAGRFGFPLDFLVTLAAQLRLRTPGRDEVVELSGARVEGHYRAHFDAVDNFQSEIALEAAEMLPADLAPSAGPSTSPGARGRFAGAGEDLQRRISSCEDALARRSRLWNHALPLAVLALHLWSLAYPAASAALRRLGGEEGATWGGVMKDLFFAVIAALSPTAMMGFALSFALSYAVAALVAWVRQVQRLEKAIMEAEDSFRSGVRDGGTDLLDGVARAIARWRAERAELAGLIGE